MLDRKCEHQLERLYAFLLKSFLRVLAINFRVVGEIIWHFGSRKPCFIEHSYDFLEDHSVAFRCQMQSITVKQEKIDEAASSTIHLRMEKLL